MSAFGCPSHAGSLIQNNIKSQEVRKKSLEQYKNWKKWGSSDQHIAPITPLHGPYRNQRGPGG